MALRIGVDFDNTIIDYRALFHSLAVARNWIPASFACDKEAIRSELIRQDGDDLRWQRLQAEAYGAEITRAEAFEGALEFLKRAEAAGHEIRIISHKTETSNLDPTVRLREAATAWAARNGLDPGKMVYASTRQEKLERIREFAPDLFVDDLAEVLMEPDFPDSVVPIWFLQGAGEAPVAKHPAGARALVPAGDWKAVAALIEVASEADPCVIAPFLARSGSLPSTVEFLKRTGNNRILLLKDGEARAVVKKSFAGEKSLNEFRAISLLWQHGLHSVPEPLFHEPARGVALYSFVPGKTVTGGEITTSHVHAAADFLVRLRGLSQSGVADSFGEAADSRRTLGDYITVVERRLSRIKGGVDSAPLAADLRQTLDDRVLPLWERLKTRFKTGVAAKGWSLDSPLPRSSRMLSPSDFGFHNCLIQGDRAVFLDLEYFGWDDPAKLISDFFHSVAQDVPWVRKWELLDRFASSLPEREPFMARFEAVLDLIGFEWILIVLNIANPEVMKRRLFADPRLQPETLVRERLEKASRLLDGIELRARDPLGRFLTVPARHAAVIE